MSNSCSRNYDIGFFDISGGVFGVLVYSLNLCKSLYEEGGEGVAYEHAFAYNNYFFLKERNLVVIEDVEDGFGGAGNEVGRVGEGLFHGGEVCYLLETVDVLCGGDCVDEVVFGGVLGEGQLDGDGVEVLFFV